MKRSCETLMSSFLALFHSYMNCVFDELPIISVVSTQERGIGHKAITDVFFSPSKFLMNRTLWSYAMLQTRLWHMPARNRLFVFALGQQRPLYNWCIGIIWEKKNGDDWFIERVALKQLFSTLLHICQIKKHPLPFTLMFNTQEADVWRGYIHEMQMLNYRRSDLP